ncbi:uncharacterized protein At3g17950-like [Curcuma longa]|uniref:uncharacterized protein At3g17950-like n=1 Tax=Curcuma longa TaxID=136217 RepID=UPI003D9EBB12
MAQQVGGWPLGLQPLNLRIDLVRNVDFSGSLSLSTLITTSPTSSSSSSSSDLDTESAGSFFRDRSSIVTLGSLIGITGLLDLSSRSLRRRKENSSSIKKKSNGGDHKAAKHWFSSLCAKAQLGGEVDSSADPSLGHFLEAERRAGDAHQTSRRTGIAVAYELEGLAPGRHSGSEPNSNSNSLFSDGRILPPATSRGGGISEGFWGLHSVHCFALLFPCMSDQVTE